ncbi:MAG TPA: hypothetical protein VMF06_02795 [Candidatus Limnocylindria bacterium]|nr:hypothetical protein [Candidatus Limnocylindria bacterium]
MKSNWMGAFCLGVALTQASQAANLFSNASFETGSMSSTTTFAGGTSSTAANSSITGWSFAPSDNSNGGQTERYISSSKAKDGTDFVYLSTINTVTGNNACLGFSPGLSFTIGQVYQFSIWAADAGSSGTLPQLAVEMSLSNGSTVNLTSVLPKNTAWSDSALTTIPWVQYTFNWTATATAANMWWSASVTNGATAGSVASLVIDNASVAPVPEASTVAAMVFAAGATGYTVWRRRSKKV